MSVVTETKSATATALENAQAALKAAQAAHVATLPVATAEQVAELCKIQEKLELSVADGKRLKEIKDAVRFRDEEKDQLAAAKQKRLTEARTMEMRKKFADACMTGHIMDARRKLRVDGRVVSTVKVLV